MQKEPDAKRCTGLVLIVDDEPPLRTTAARILEHWGYRTLLAANGREALEVFRTHATAVSAVLLDMIMPELGGAETFRELQKCRSDVRVVLTSGYEEADALRAFPASALAGFLKKPYSADELATCIRAAIEGSGVSTVAVSSDD
jgi:CheY-like chemotaxis protein